MRVNVEPVEYSTLWFFKVFVVLGFGKSKRIVLGISTSLPLMYALPAEILYIPRSSEGVLPPYVNWPVLNIPPFPVSLFKLSFVVTENGLT